jgi:hypothetical protein
MQRDTLFLLKHDFTDGSAQRQYCPDCAHLNGVLHYYPNLRHLLDVRYLDFARPRSEIVSMLGEENQSCPVLVLGPRAPREVKGVDIQVHGVWRFINRALEIGTYLSRVYGVGLPH